MSLKVLTAGLITLSSAFALAQGATEDQIKVLDQLRAINQKEIAAGQLAQQKATNPEVRDYGKRLVSDHKKLEAQVAKYAKDHKLSITAPGTAELGDLTAATGTDFDKKFLDEMVKGHEDAIHLVKSARTTTTDKDFKAFLSAALPSLEKHHATAEKLEKKANI